MSKINVLTEDLINKIAAGEVIERPASVVKELIENSLDALATKIIIDIEDSGKKLIRVRDNGEGMDETDAKQSVIRHATSKIKDVDDLFSINTLGFRGEALASIAAVSQLSIITKQKDKLEGFNLVIEGGKTISSGILAAETGTTIEIKNIFFNTPARKKFMKTDQVEIRHIIEIVTRYALINPKVSIKLSHEGHLIINSASVDNLQNNIASIYGISLAKELLEIKYETPEVQINGFIAKPHLARNDKNQQSIYVNGRWIKNEELTKSIYDAYHSLLFVNKHPILIINLNLDPTKIDVNVHPNKSEIKIEQINTVKNALFTAIKETLEKNNLIPVMDFEFEQQLTFGTPSTSHIARTEKKEAKYNFEASQQGILNGQMIHSGDYINEEDNFTDEGNISNIEDDIFIPEQHLNEQLPGNIKLPAMKILGQVHKTFFIAETEGGMLIIDQHVVQERVLYEKFMNEYMNKNVAVQTLLKPELLDFSPAEKQLIIENLDTLKKLGFILEEFGENTFVIKTTPTIFGRTQAKDLLYEVLSGLLSGMNKIEQVQEEIITRMACRASVKAGDVMTIPEIQNLLNQLSKTILPYTCPHGRSVLIKLDVDELEKKFRRK
ncbi:MAG: DNA mismatch repair endonuclease MutL, partial [Candidatus Woesearchaeota archaeon]